MKAVFILKSISGLGDMYSTLLSVYIESKFLQSKGYSCQLIWDNSRNLYINAYSSFDKIFNFSKLNIPVTEVYEEYFDKIIGNKYTLLPQNQNSYMIYLDEVLPSITDYQSCVYSISQFRFDSDSFNKIKHQIIDLLTDDVLNIANEYIKNAPDKLSAIHLRLTDGSIDKTINDINIQNDISKIKIADDIIDKNRDINFLLCTNNLYIKKYFKHKYNNVYINKFTYDTLTYYSYQSILTDNEYIRHCQEMAGEMACFRFCNKVYPLSSYGWLSSYLTYGFIHNEFSPTLQDKLKTFSLT